MLHEYREHQIIIRRVLFGFVNIYLNRYRIPNDDNLPQCAMHHQIMHTRRVHLCLGIGRLYMYME